MKKLLLLPVLLLSMFASKAQAPKIIYVNASAIGAGNGTSWTDAYVDFQAGVNGAAAGDSVFVAKGNYQPAISGTSFSMKEGVKIYGGFAGTEGSLSERNLPANLIAGDSSVLKGHDKRVIDNTSNNLTAAAVLDGFNISNGKAISGYGGGIYNISSSPTITNCTFLGNSAGNGGGIYNDNASPIITNCTFSGNTSGYYGGGIYSLSSSPIITNCTFVGNTSSNGGGIFSYQSSPILTNCIFVGNTAATGGGGGNGSGAVQTDASPIFTNCTFVSNRAQSGGAIYDELSSTLTNCIFWGNTATTGADILKYGNTTLDYSYTQNNLIAYGTGNITGSTDPFVNSSNPGGADGIYGTPDDGLHLNFAAGYFATGASPIDAGSNAAIPTGISTDIAGADRNQNSTVDMGAYEGISATQALPVTIMNFRGSLQKGIVTLQWESGLEAGFNHFEL
ncbi:MAG TPA: right-handed parallel beta-helix repeat-containing protein, partial [Arachidicoccus sp.]|nr:right-handed parallel beta-helix repeat-containing protein [Arachidicoccus sp.]